MRTVVIREVSNGTLLPLKALLERFDHLDVSYWAFKEVHIYQGMPFGMHVSVFEKLTRELNGGFMVRDADFRNFLAGDFQVVDGLIEAWDSSGMLLSIDCEDAAQWVLFSSRPAMFEQLDKIQSAASGTHR